MKVNSAKAVTLQELLNHVKISEERLKEPCSEEHLLEIARNVDNWEIYAPYFLEFKDIEDLKDKFKPELQCQKAFFKWQERAAFKATYLYLVESVFLKQGNAKLAVFVCNLVK